MTLMLRFSVFMIMVSGVSCRNLERRSIAQFEEDVIRRSICTKTHYDNYIKTSQKLTTSFGFCHDALRMIFDREHIDAFSPCVDQLRDCLLESEENSTYKETIVRKFTELCFRREFLDSNCYGLRDSEETKLGDSPIFVIPSNAIERKDGSEVVVQSNAICERPIRPSSKYIAFLIEDVDRICRIAIEASRQGLYSLISGLLCGGFVLFMMVVCYWFGFCR